MCENCDRIKAIAISSGVRVPGTQVPNPKYRGRNADGEMTVHGHTREEFNHAMDVFLARYIDGRDMTLAELERKGYGPENPPPSTDAVLDEHGEARRFNEVLSEDILNYFSQDLLEAAYAVACIASNAETVLMVRAMREAGLNPYSDGGEGRLEL